MELTSGSQKEVLQMWRSWDKLHWPAKFRDSEEQASKRDTVPPKQDLHDLAPERKALSVILYTICGPEVNCCIQSSSKVN